MASVITAEKIFDHVHNACGFDDVGHLAETTGFILTTKIGEQSGKLNEKRKKCNERLND